MNRLASCSQEWSRTFPDPAGRTAVRPTSRPARRAGLREWGSVPRRIATYSGPSARPLRLIVLPRGSTARGRRAFIAIAALVGAGNALYGRNSHGKKAMDRVRAAQEAQTWPPTWPPRPAGPWPRPSAGRALLPPRPRPTPGRHHPPGEPLPRQGRRPAHLPPGRGRQDHRLPDRAPRQGQGRGQGRPQDQLQVRRTTRAAHPTSTSCSGRAGATSTSSTRSRSSTPSARYGRTSTACPGAWRCSR